MASYAAALQVAVRATTIAPPERIYWYGMRAVPPLPARLHRVLGADQVREYLQANLQRHLYMHYYCTGGATPWPAIPPRAASVSAHAFVERLSQANVGAGRLQAGWDGRADGDNTVFARRHGLSLWLRREECVSLPSPGDGTFAIRLPKELPARLPGFYVAVSDAPLGDEEWRDIVRIYWNVSPRGASSLVHAITRRLNADRAPFHLKVPSDPTRYNRCDTAVLYIRREDFPALRDALRAVSTEIAAHLRPAIPALTKPLERGIALAEDPGRGESFGAHRCDLIADALLRAHHRGIRAAEPRWTEVATRFAECGVDLERPYLNPDSRDDYDWRRAPNGSTAAPAHEVAAPREPGVEQLRAVAAGIADALCSQAIWDRDRCTWLGTTYDRLRGEGVSTLGGDLYSGTAGVALFLGEFAVATGSAAARRTAIAAMGQSLATAAELFEHGRAGLYTGWTGVAYAAARLGLILEHNEFTRAARALVRRGIARRPLPAQFDLLAGSAGAISALLALAGLLHERAPAFFAMRLGDQLLRNATRRSGAWAWKMERRSREPPLTGYAHGAAGVADALLLLHDATGESRYRRAAERAFAYELLLYNRAEGNWPDLRGRAASPRLARAYPCNPFWCHGAPGIALSRLHAYRSLGDGPWVEEARRALETTRRATSKGLLGGGLGFSLCHGLAGNAEILLLGDAALAEHGAHSRATAMAVAASGMERFAASGAWPLDFEGPLPGLMTGLAGIGLFYLRLMAPDTPSILSLDPGSVSRGPPGAPARGTRSSRAPSAVDVLMPRVERGLRAAIRCDDARIVEICGHYLGAGGKRLRPALVLLAAACGGRGTAEAVRYAVAIELLHTATLYHDDIVDRATMRRAQPSANARWGNSVSALAGGFLFARAMHAFADAGARVDRVAAMPCTGHGRARRPRRGEPGAWRSTRPSISGSSRSRRERSMSSRATWARSPAACPAAMSQRCAGSAPSSASASRCWTTCSISRARRRISGRASRPTCAGGSTPSP